jgi:glycosyltransferase involved in cell wall biosynthesis
MRVLIATDAWHPQVNGVVRTLTSLAESARKLGVEITFLTPEGFASIPVPTYPGLRCALPSPREIARRIEDARPDAIHIATEGTIGHLVRRYCRKQGRPFTTSYTTRFPEYISARLALPEAWTYAWLRRFHSAATVTMVSTPSLTTELAARGFTNLGMWTRGVNTDLFRPERAIDLGLPRPIFISVGRIAVEKNLAAFLSCLGLLDERVLPAYLAGSDVFVFPSRTDTFGVVQLEALACGVPVAAYPVTGPKDVIGNNPIGVLNDDLRVACMSALHLSREACRNFALAHSWEASARQFIGHLDRVAIGKVRTPRAA